MRERALCAIAECRHLATMTEEPGRTTRRFLTPPVHEVHAHLRRRMADLEMDVRVDAVGNLRGLWKPPNAHEGRLILGSHIDTVPDAGAYDGVLGVMLAIECVEIAREIAFPMPIEVIAFSEEEGVRFGIPVLGSRAVVGRFTPALLELKDAEGITLDQAIRAFGLDPALMDETLISEDAAAYVEFHIEQGPVLEAEGLSVAVVSSIVGQTRLTLEFAGQANHAGTTPMRLRRDALAAAAEWISAVEELATRSDGLVATVGKIALEPNATNVIPGRARVSLDVRHTNNHEREAAVEDLVARAQELAARRGLTMECTRQVNGTSVPMDERITAYLADAVEAAGFPARTMPSGAGHDAMVLATRVPAGMLFLRSPGGISHHPTEAVREEDVEAALLVARQFLMRLASEFRV
ncbi:MAG TPA: allantoate amidohydrolase [Candidatus Sulfopaludibacter sp.]|nr:allantoate amidohydrolase [Candidatus Sulfopaludibacter sp.]